MSSLGLVADRWHVVTNAAGDAWVLGSGGHAEVFLVEDEGRQLKDDDGAPAREEGDMGGGGGGGDDGDGRPLVDRPKRKTRKKKRYALKIDKSVSAGCVGTVRHEITVLRSLEGVPGVVRLAPELEAEEEVEEEEEGGGDADGEKGGGDPDERRRKKKRRREQQRRRSSTVSGTLKDGRSWVVMELLGATLAGASVAAGAVAPRSSRRRAAVAAAEEEAGGRKGAGGGVGGSSCCWTAEDVRAAASSMLAALAAMHAAGWVHRDVKPANFALALPEEEEEEEALPLNQVE